MNKQTLIKSKIIQAVIILLLECWSYELNGFAAVRAQMQIKYIVETEKSTTEDRLYLVNNEYEKPNKMEWSRRAELKEHQKVFSAVQNCRS